MQPDESKLRKVLATLAVDELMAVRESGWVTEAAIKIINEEIANRSGREREQRTEIGLPEETIFDYIKWRRGSSGWQNIRKRLITLSLSSVVLSIFMNLQDEKHSSSDFFYIFGFTLGIMGIAGIAFAVLAPLISLLFRRKFSLKFYTNLYTAAWVLTCVAIFFGNDGSQTNW